MNSAAQTEYSTPATRQTICGHRRSRPLGFASPLGVIEPPRIDSARLGAAARVLKPGERGKLLGGIYSSPIPPIDYPLIYHERIVRSVANSTRQDARELLALAADIPIETETEVYALGEANEALLALKESRINGAGVLRIG